MKRDEVVSIFQHKIMLVTAIWVRQRSITSAELRILRAELDKNIPAMLERCDRNNITDDIIIGLVIETAKTMFTNEAIRTKIKAEENVSEYDRLEGSVRYVAECLCEQLARSDARNPPLFSVMSNHKDKLPRVAYRLIDELVDRREISNEMGVKLYKKMIKNTKSLLKRIPSYADLSSPREVLEAVAPFINDELFEMNRGTASNDVFSH